MTDLERANQRAASAEKEAVMLQERWVEEERKHLSFCEFRLQELNKQESGEQVNLEAEGEGLALRGQLAAKEAEVATLLVDLQKATKASAEEEGRRLKRESELEVALASTVQERDQLASKLAMQVNAQLNFYFLSLQPKSHRRTMKE